MPKGDNFKGKKPTNTPGKPSTRAEVDKRVTQVAKLLIQGYARYEIVGIVGGEYNLHPSTVDEYIKKAKERIKAKNEESLDDEVAVVEARILDVYQGARRAKKRGDASRAIKLHMELKGLEAPKKIKINPLTDEEKKQIDFLMDRNLDD